MRIIAHRGYATDGSIAARNRIGELDAALRKGYDIETDLRFRGTEPIVAHDPVPLNQRVPTLADVCALLSKYPGRWAWLDVKEDSLAPPITRIADKFGVLGRCVSFDHSAPDRVWTCRNFPSLTVARRTSRYEGAYMPGSKYVIVDCFDAEKEGPEKVLRRIKNAQMKDETEAVVISPELHYPQCFKFWNMRQFALGLRDINPFAIITDQCDFYMGKGPNS